MKSLERVAKFLKLNQKYFNSPEEDYERERRNEPGFDPGPEKVRIPKRLRQEISEDIDDLLLENPDLEIEDIYEILDPIYGLDQWESEGWTFLYDVVQHFKRDDASLNDPYIITENLNNNYTNEY